MERLPPRQYIQQNVRVDEDLHFRPPYFAATASSRSRSSSAAEGKRISPVAFLVRGAGGSCNPEVRPMKLSILENIAETLCRSEPQASWPAGSVPCQRLASASTFACPLQYVGSEKNKHLSMLLSIPPRLRMCSVAGTAEGQPRLLGPSGSGPPRSWPGALGRSPRPSRESPTRSPGGAGCRVMWRWIQSIGADAFPKYTPGKSS
jgi:hypothetical protein